MSTGSPTPPPASTTAATWLSCTGSCAISGSKRRSKLVGEREDIPQIMARADVVLAARCDHIPWAQRSPDDPKSLRPVSSAHRPRRAASIGHRAG